MALVDLHTHSNASDGELSPTALVRLAAASGLAAVALTDHDTLSGLEEAMEAGRANGVEVVPGCELSVADGRRELHVLGLWVRPGASRLERVLEDMRESREERNRRIVGNLNALGIGLDYEEVAALAGGTVGRPHIARVLMERGVVRDYDAAFRQYLGRQGRAFAPKRALALQEALDVLREAGATTVLAHPYLLGENGRAMEELARRYRDMGAQAVEAYYTEHSMARTHEYLALARKLDMGVSGGSDFHGSVKPRIRLGRGKGRLAVPEAVLDDLKDRRKTLGLWT